MFNPISMASARTKSFQIFDKAILKQINQRVQF
jgi:hypothetical protein